MRWIAVAVVAGCSSGGGHPPDGGTCMGPGPESGFSIATPSGAIEPGPYVVLTGTGSGVQVDGSVVSVREDPMRGVWTYVHAASPGQVDLAVAAGVDSVGTHVMLGTRTLPPGDFSPSMHTVGSWMFSWFRGDSSWTCQSPWQPAAGFVNWNGEVWWARAQLLDQIDAHLDLVGLQLDSDDSSYRFTNVMNVAEAARQLWQEGYAPPRIFPFLDTAIIADHWMTANGTTLDLSTDPGRAYLYGHAQKFYAGASPEVIARSQGAPYVGLWHSTTINGEDSAAVLDFKSRFHTDFGADPYLVAHPNDWRLIPEVDEITLMFGPPTHFYSGGRDGGGAPTVNVEAGFWNPISNTFYLPRQGGASFDTAWASAQGVHGTSHHLYIDSWNETGEGSGIFDAMPVTYTASDTGPCGQFVNTHDESWGPTGRHYIDTTRAQATMWNDAPDLDAQLLGHDIPSMMAAGEKRWVSVVMQNVGDATWTTAGLVATSADTFGVTTPVAPIGDVPHGYPGAIPILLEAPCTPGTYTLSLQMTGGGAPFGGEVSVAIAVD